MNLYLQLTVRHLIKLFILPILYLFSCHVFALTPSTIQVNNSWIRFTPGNGPLAGYFKLVNDTPNTIKLVGAKSTVFGGVMMHHSSITHGEASMQSVDDGLVIKAGEQLVFAPGGYHLMLMMRQQKLAVGDKITIQLIFLHQPTISVDFIVKPIWFQGIK